MKPSQAKIQIETEEEPPKAFFKPFLEDEDIDPSGHLTSTSISFRGDGSVRFNLFVGLGPIISSLTTCKT